MTFFCNVSNGGSYKKILGPNERIHPIGELTSQYGAAEGELERVGAPKLSKDRRLRSDEVPDRVRSTEDRVIAMSHKTSYRLLPFCDRCETQDFKRKYGSFGHQRMQRSNFISKVRYLFVNSVLYKTRVLMVELKCPELKKWQELKKKKERSTEKPRKRIVKKPRTPNHKWQARKIVKRGKQRNN